MLVRELNNVLLGGVFSVVEFRPVDDGEGITSICELLSGKVSQWFDKGKRRYTVVVEKTPRRLRYGKGMLDACREAMPVLEGVDC